MKKKTIDEKMKAIRLQLTQLRDLLDQRQIATGAIDEADRLIRQLAPSLTTEQRAKTASQILRERNIPEPIFQTLIKANARINKIRRGAGTSLGDPETFLSEIKGFNAGDWMNWSIMVTDPTVFPERRKLHSPSGPSKAIPAYKPREPEPGSILHRQFDQAGKLVLTKKIETTRKVRRPRRKMVSWYAVRLQQIPEECATMIRHIRLIQNPSYDDSGQDPIDRSRNFVRLMTSHFRSLGDNIPGEHGNSVETFFKTTPVLNKVDATRFLSDQNYRNMQLRQSEVRDAVIGLINMRKDFLMQDHQTRLAEEDFVQSHPFQDSSPPKP